MCWELRTGACGGCTGKMKGLRVVQSENALLKGEGMHFVKW